MSYWLAIFLGAVQGLTEFLPVSSSGHLVLLQKIFGVGEVPVCFNTMVHLGTLVAVVIFFGRGLMREGRESGVIGRILAGTVPVAVVGFLVQQFLLEEIFGSLLLVGLGFLVTGALLFWSRRLDPGIKGIKGLKDSEVLAIGCFQAAALLPGISRSGATIVGGLSQKLDREESFKFSFYLSVPAIIGANILQLKNLSAVNFLPQSLVGMVVAFAVGMLSLRALQRILQAEKLYYFSFYCFFVGIITLLTNVKILF